MIAYQLTRPIVLSEYSSKINNSCSVCFLQPDRYQPVAQRILSRFGNESQSSVPISQIAIPDLSLPLQLSRRDSFTLFIPSHRKMATRLTELFMGEHRSALYIHIFTANKGLPIFRPTWLVKLWDDLSAI